MSSRTHNKKRNVILMYEFLIRAISVALLNNDQKMQTEALKILKKNFKKSSELYKEFRLANSLYKTTVSNSSVASSILFETKNAVRKINKQKLEKEKSILIREINYFLGKDVYDFPITNYKTLATIQILFNEWKENSIDIMSLANYEDKINVWLTEQKKNFEDNDSNIMSDYDVGTIRLASKLMLKKINEKYNITLNNTQKELIHLHTLSETSQANTSKLMTILENIKFQLSDKLSNIDSLSNELNEIKNMVTNDIITEDTTDDTITKFMLYSSLIDELGEKNVK